MRVDWLKAHNLVVFDFEALAITITRQQKSVSLQGIGERSLQSEFWYSEICCKEMGWIYKLHLSATVLIALTCENNVENRTITQSKNKHEKKK